jgi:hypothetical protein
VTKFWQQYATVEAEGRVHPFDITKPNGINDTVSFPVGHLRQLAIAKLVQNGLPDKVVSYISGLPDKDIKLVVITEVLEAENRFVGSVFYEPGARDRFTITAAFAPTGGEELLRAKLPQSRFAFEPDTCIAV